MILVDSSVWIAYFRGTDTPQTATLDALLGREPLLVGDLILIEVLQGFTSDAEFIQARNLLVAFKTVELCTEELAIQAAINFRALRKRGVTVRKTIDTVIATCCIENDFALLYSDRDFDSFVEHLGLRQAASLLPAGGLSF